MVSCWWIPFFGSVGGFPPVCGFHVGSVAIAGPRHRGATRRRRRRRRRISAGAGAGAEEGELAEPRRLVPKLTPVVFVCSTPD